MMDDVFNKIPRDTVHSAVKDKLQLGINKILITPKILLFNYHRSNYNNRFNVFKKMNFNNIEKA